MRVTVRRLGNWADPGNYNEPDATVAFIRRFLGVVTGVARPSARGQ